MVRSKHLKYRQFVSESLTPRID